MFIDEAEVELIAGHGGSGKVSFHRPPQKGPDGGNGGKGGGIYLRSSDSISSLGYFTRHTKVSAGNGEAGQSNRKTGKNALDLYIEIPASSQIIDLQSGETFTFPKPEITILLCEGGKGGKGNYEFRSSRNTTPQYAQPGLAGQSRKVKIHIKLIADIGLIGLPNSGKSSLLNELTSSNAKVGDYPFTTLEPNLGVLEKNLPVGRQVIADIPGIIEGASAGKGLGLKFLKHIEKVRLILHCIPSDSLDPTGDYHKVRKELVSYNPRLSRKKEVILLTKSDLTDEKGLNELLSELSTLEKPILAVSIYNYDSLEQLKKIL
ncbi:GTPase ObgE [Candidatus Daviesbacteria bacterium]|nr:GTPase ObgE [Candidatus Daviesbacteria bacterium]